jgi:hypothetical protein
MLTYADRKDALRKVKMSPATPLVVRTKEDTMQARPTHARTLGVRGLSLRLSLAAPCGKERVRLEVGVEEEEEDEEKQEEEEEEEDKSRAVALSFTHTHTQQTDRHADVSPTDRQAC